MLMTPTLFRVIVDVWFCVTHLGFNIEYNQSCKVCLCGDTHLFVPTVLLRGDLNVTEWRKYKVVEADVRALMEHVFPAVVDVVAHAKETQGTLLMSNVQNLVCALALRAAWGFPLMCF